MQVELVVILVVNAFVIQIFLHAHYRNVIIFRQHIQAVDGPAKDGFTLDLV